VKRSSLLLLVLLTLGSSLAAQQTLLERKLWLTLPDALLAFEVPAASYPSLSPETRLRLSTPDGTLPLVLTSALEGGWSLLLSVSDLLPVAGGTPLPTGNVRYRVNGGTWLTADGTPQVLYTALGPTPPGDPVRLRLEFELKVPARASYGGYWLDLAYSGLAF